ncbi:MAG: PIG-L family deacetylase [Deltaproteobacteria bacterium]|jgi:LmbE family N-acetylglucosaminyl deacetylase|nr:MAG: PIG-L family deacetylase [Deltaproteobacteria bacterium]
MKKMNILAIGAHPDDVEFGCGGTLIKYSDRGHHLYLLVMTEGGLGAAKSLRKAEQSGAQDVLGVERIFWGAYEDTYLQVDKDIISEIENVINEVKPDFIFCHYPDDTHQDHRHLAQAVISATRYVRNVLFYEGPTSQNFDPQIFVEISDSIDRKMDALKAHRSQITKTNIEDLTIVELARSTANFRGTQGRVKFAEAFSALRLFINI